MKAGLISASLVTYHNPEDEIKSVIDSFLGTELECILFISDNSNNRDIEEVCSDEKIKYIYNGTNLGFGAAHNLAIKEAINLNSEFHFVLNPDVKFSSNIIQILVNRMRKDSEVGAIMPKILNLDHSIQYLPKLLPSPFRLLIRLSNPLRKVFNKQYSHYVLENYDDIELNVPTLSGCFSLYNLKAIKDVGFFDERFFMYFEDNDLTRRIHKKYKTLYYPSVNILHGYGRGAAKDFRLFKIYVKSAITYFNKYGWFFDKERRQFDKKVLNQINQRK
ncbi:MAG: glycosyltransferase [Clostridiales bacterium]|nr:glycosyltransferase [Clostridiales bacterium]